VDAQTSTSFCTQKTPRRQRDPTHNISGLLDGFPENNLNTMYNMIVACVIISNKNYAIAVYPSRLSELRTSNMVFKLKRRTRRLRFQPPAQ